MTDILNCTQSEEIFSAAQEIMPGGVSSPVRAFKSVGGQPIVFDRVKGPFAWDIDGNRYIDYIGSWGPAICGHAHPEVITALQEALEKGTSFGAPCVLENKLAEMVIEAVPSVEMVRFVNSGTEACMAVLRLMRAYTGRDKVIKFDGCYHGHADMFLVKAGSGVATLGLPDSPGVPRTTTSNTLTAPYNDLEAVKQLFSENPDAISGVILEPIVGNAGFITPEPGFLEGLRELTTENGALLVFDEVMTGFGRTGVDFSSNFYNLRPDILVAGKGMAAGYAAISGTYSTDEIADSILKAGYEVMFHTFAALPQSCAASTTVLKILRRENLCEKVDPLGDQLKQKLISELGQHPLVAEIRGQGLLIGVEIVKEKEGLICFEEKEKVTSQIMMKGLEDGVFLYPGGTGEFRDIICLGPAFTIGDEEIELMVKAVKNSLEFIANKYS